jgi:hypothetical protein
MSPDIVEAQWLRIADQDAQHTAATREVADRLACFVVDTDGQKLFELPAVFVENTERSVLCVREFAGGVEDALKDDLEIELCDEASADVDEASKPFLALPGIGRHFPHHPR